MLSGLFSANTAAHCAVAAATSSCGPAIAVGAERAMLIMSAIYVVLRRACIVSSLISILLRSYVSVATSLCLFQLQFPSNNRLDAKGSAARSWRFARETMLETVRFIVIMVLLAQATAADNDAV